MDDATNTIRTVTDWQVALRKSSDALIEAHPRPTKAGNIAGALNAAARGAYYKSRGVVHLPGCGKITIATYNNDHAQTTARRLERLVLPGVSAIEYGQKGSDLAATVTLVLAPKPQVSL